MGLMDYVQNTEHVSDALVRMSREQLEDLKNTGDRFIQLFNGTEPVLDEKIVGPRDLKVTWTGISQNHRITHAVMKFTDPEQKEQRFEIGPVNVVAGDDLTLNLR